MAPKILLVGDKWICPQVAYVMGWQNYVMVEQLAGADVNKYADYKIVICAFKRHRRRYAPVGGGGYTYLDEICRELDQGYSLKEQLSLFEQRTKFKRLAKSLLSSRCGEWLRRIITIRNPKLLKKLPPLLLKPSELFVYVLQSPPAKMTCSSLENVCDINADGILSGCCGVRLPFGRVSEHKSLAAVYNSPLARIIKLSSLNGSFCLCNLRKCKYADFTQSKPRNPAGYQTSTYPHSVAISTDPSCNLKCGSCRKNFYTADDKTTQRIMALHQQVLASGWLEKTETLTMCGMGEVFYSVAYRQLLANLSQRHQINIQSNGTLLTPQNWAWLADKYQTIKLSISIDAATSATYQKLRGGNFQQLLQNLTMLGDLRRREKIARFDFCFVVQNDNWQEMVDFVALAKKLHVDKVKFVPLDNWLTYSRHEWRRRNIIKRNRCLSPELYFYLQDPIFTDPIVDLRSFTPYLVNSAKRYGE